MDDHYQVRDSTKPVISLPLACLLRAVELTWQFLGSH
jgi:hypothetical protein